MVVLGFILFSVLFFINQVRSIYEMSRNIILLNSSNFLQVIQSDDLWIIEFYDPICPTTITFAEEFEVIGNKLMGIVRLGAINRSDPLTQRYEIKEFPTLLIFERSKTIQQTIYSGSKD